MDDHLPFLSPAQDPPGETTARARARVRRTVHRRRARRRVLVSVPVVAAVAALAVGVTGTWPGGGRTDLVTPSGDVGTPGRLRVDPDTPWSEATLARDGRTLTILVGSAPAGSGPCQQAFDYDVAETSTAVTVGFEERPAAPTSEAVACADIAQPQRFTIRLDRPLGDRQVYDGITDGPRRVHRLADLVEVTHLPAGWTRSEDYGTGKNYDGWQQTFRREGADWYFAVNQEPAPGAVPPQDGTATPVMVNGIAGQRFTGQMNDTMETIRWVDGGIAISVWGEMQGPPTFTHHDELLDIAEGVRLPGG